MFGNIWTHQHIAGYTALLSVIASASIFGWVTPIMNYFLDPSSDMYMTTSQASWMVAIIEFGLIFGSVPGGIMADKLGRKVTLLLTGPTYAITWLFIIFWKSYTVLCVMRVIQGVIMCISFIVVPLYLGEITSPAIRGSVTGLYSMAWFVGYIIEYCIGPFVSYEIFALITAAIPVVFTVLFAFQPESPYYLLMKGRETEAKAALEWLRSGSSEESIKSELKEIHDSIKSDFENKASWKDVVATAEDRRALLVILIIHDVRIFSGAIVLMSYSTNLFTETGTTFLSPDMLTIIMGFTMIIGGFVNSSIVDSLGRRPLLFISCIGSTFSSFIVGLYIYIQKETSMDVSQFSWIVPLGVIVYCEFYVVGLFPISMTYTSELFTTKTRGKAASISTINLSVASFFCLRAYQVLGDGFGLYTPFWFFAFVSLLGGVMLYYLAPETKGRTFTEIREQLLHVTKQSAKSNITV